MDENPRPAIGTVQSLLWITSFGVGFVLVAMVSLQWPLPTPPDTPVLTDLLLHRITARIAAGGLGNALEFLVFALPLAALWLIVVAWRRNDPKLLVGVALVGVFGIFYAGGMALYLGPMVSIFGFVLLISSGLLAWAASPPESAEVSSEESASEEQLAPAEIIPAAHSDNNALETVQAEATGSTVVDEPPQPSEKLSEMDEKR